MKALSIVSDNIANANTTGWKSNIVDFGDMVSGLINCRRCPLRSQGVGSSVLGVTSNFTTGSEIQTGNWSDLMNPGHRVLLRPEPHQQRSLLHQGWVVRGQFGRPFSPIWKANDVLDSAGKTITIAAGTHPDLTVDQFGNLTGVLSGGTTATYIDHGRGNDLLEPKRSDPGGKQ